MSKETYIVMHVIYIHRRTHTYINIHTHTHTYTNTHTHTQTKSYKQLEEYQGILADLGKIKVCAPCIRV